MTTEYSVPNETFVTVSPTPKAVLSWQKKGEKGTIVRCDRQLLLSLVFGVQWDSGLSTYIGCDSMRQTFPRSMQTKCHHGWGK